MTSPAVSIADDDMPRLSLGAKKEAVLIKSLSALGPLTRLNAASKLGELQVRDSVAHLIGKLSDENPQVRAEVVRALGLLHVTRIAPRIYRILVQDPSPLVRAKAAVALGEMGYAEARDAIMALMDRPDIRERIAAVKAMGKLGGAKVFKHLVRLLNSGTGELKEAVIYSLGEHGDKRSASHVRKYIDSKNIGIQKAAMVALSTLEPQTVRQRLNQLLLKSNTEFQLTALDVTARLHCTTCQDTIRFLIEKGNDDVSGGAASTAAWLNLKSLSPDIHKRLHMNPSVQARMKFMWSLGRLGYMPVLNEAYDFLESPVPDLRLVALGAIRLLRPRDPQLVGKVAPLAYETEPSVAGEAFSLLAEYGYRGFVSKNVLKKIKSPILISAIAGGLPWLGKMDGYVISALRRWLSVNNYEVQKASIRALGILRENRAMPKLLSLLYHQDAQVKMRAIFAIGLINHPDARTTLQYLISKDADPHVRALAWLSYSLGGMTRDQELLVLNHHSETLAGGKMALAFTYALALVARDYKGSAARLQNFFDTWFSRGENSSVKAQTLELLLLLGNKRSRQWFEIAARSGLYRVRAMALLWLARFREPTAIHSTKKSVQPLPAPVMKKTKQPLKLPFSSQPDESASGCGCASSGSPRDVLPLFPLLLLLAVRRFRHRS
ncbi:HEAT repeat domain-containing protein [Myxococcota bacterium]|nr:HEAT repeat domain-containing protein [Myxococcota bacterium]MBU1537596.1 HEAT repeat domain-containing protein [Myxococcota bacterium]